MERPLLPDHYLRIFKALPGAFLLLLPDTAFTIADASDEYLRATLRQRQDIVGRPLFDVFPDNPATPEANSTQNLSRSLQRVVATRATDVMAIQRYDVPLADGSGFEERYWSPVNAPVLTADGKLLCIVHRVDNVTDFMRVMAENARQRYVSAQLSADNVRMAAEIVERSRELDQANRHLHNAAASKDEFLAMLAHELRNPLAAMSSALQLAALGPADERRQQALLDVCRRQVNNLTRLVDDLLEMSRIDRGEVALQRAPLDLREVVDNAIHAVRELFERRRLTIVTRLAPERFGMHGDATRLEQVLANLLTNAAKFSEPGGKVEVQLDAVAGNGRWARLEVRDTGRGIPPDKLDAIFDIFVQVDTGVDRSRGGLGIGLSLVRAIVELHGGRVTAHSAGLGHGSSFVIELPLPTPEDADGTDEEPPPVLPAATGQGQRILLIEDHADTRETLLALLTAFGYTVTTAANGGEGLDKLLALRPDIAIIDIGLPELDGFEVARRARPIVGAATRLIALTGYNTPVVRTTALDAGFDLHVTKPCTPAKLAEILAPRQS